jgi:hypothetical protein
MRPSSGHVSPEKCRSDHAPSVCRDGWMNSSHSAKAASSRQVRWRTLGAALVLRMSPLLYQRLSAVAPMELGTPCGLELPLGAETQCYPAVAEPNLRYTSTAGLGPG